MKIEPALKSWAFPKNREVVEKYSGKNYVAISVKRTGFVPWDTIFGNIRLMDGQGRTGIVPRTLAYHYDLKWSFIPAYYLKDIDPALLNGVRKLPIFRASIPTTTKKAGSRK